MVVCSADKGVLIQDNDMRIKHTNTLTHTCTQTHTHSYTKNITFGEGCMFSLTLLFNKIIFKTCQSANYILIAVHTDFRHTVDMG